MWVCMWCVLPKRPEEGVEFRESGVTVVGNSPKWVLRTELLSAGRSRKEHYMPLTAKPFLQHQ